MDKTKFRFVNQVFIVHIEVEDDCEYIFVILMTYFLKTFFFNCKYSNESLNGGLVVVIDGQKCSWRMTRLVIRHVTTLIGENLSNAIVVRPDAFWDKQHVENCAKTQKKGEVR